MRHRRGGERALLLAGLVLGVASGAAAQRPSGRLPERGDTVPTLRTRAAIDSVRARRNRPRPLLAVAEGTGVNVFLQVMNRYLRHADWAQISLDSWKNNLRYGWEWDVDQFQTNMFGHPYGGGFYFNAGRDNGLSFWGAAPLTFLGSFEWEYFGENLRPSLNDLYMTAISGIAFGEVGHRLGGLVRSNRARGVGRVAREIAALPLDPVGSFNRILRGEFLRVSADPNDRDRSPLLIEVQTGARIAVDSGPARERSMSGSLLADVSYGDSFARGYRQPFDVFRLRVQLSNKGGINLARIRGRLYGRELTDTAAAARTVFTVALKSEYVAGPAYKFGGPSLESGLVSDFRLTPRWHIQSEAYGEWLVLAGIEAPGAGSRARTYDFGPGVGVNTAATLQFAGRPILSARYRFAYVHTVSGSKADHRTNFVSLEASIPVSNAFGIGFYASWYRQRSVYAAGAGALLSYPELRAYLSWRGGRGPVPLQGPGGNAL